MEAESIAKILIGIILLFWLYKCMVRVRENQFKIIEKWNKDYVRTTSGRRGIKAATANDVGPGVRLGQLIPGKRSNSISFIPWPYHRVATYKIRLIVDKDTGEVKKRISEGTLTENNIAWGNLETDESVSITTTSISDHYRWQFTYEWHFDGLETGTPVGSKDSAQNIKVRFKLNVTIQAFNPYETMYQENDGGKWITVETAVIMSALSEVVAVRSFNDISLLRSKKLDDVELDGGKTFCQRINEQMLDIKHFGQETIDMDFIDYEIMYESKDFIKSLSDNATAKIRQETAKLEADAQRELLKPKEEVAIKILRESNKLKMQQKGKVDATIDAKFKSLEKSNVRVYIEAADGSASNGSGQIDVEKVIGGVLNLDIVKEINDEANNNSQNRNNKNRK